MEKLKTVHIMISFILFFLISTHLSAQWVNNGLDIYYNTGKVGIGTASPSNKLTVYDGELTLQTDNNTEKQGILYQNSAGSYTWRIYRSNAGSSYANLRFASGLSTDINSLTDRMVINNNGRMGIGTTSPNAKLEVKGSNAATGVRVAWGPQYGNLWGEIRQAGSGGLVINSNANGTWADIDMQTDGTCRMFINHNGNIGIGTKTPGKKLDVIGRLKFRSNNTNSAGFWLTGNDGNEQAFIGQQGMASSDAVGIWHGNQWRFSVESNGRVGIGTGTQNAHYTLDVRGVISNGGSDFILGKFDGRNQGSVDANRALVHTDTGIGNDNLIINFAGDFEGGVNIAGPKLVVDGSVGIGTSNMGSYKMAVEGKLGAREIEVTLSAWADFVFDERYSLMPLDEVEKHIKDHKHLPGVPSEDEILDSPVNLGEMDALLMQKIEELTLYVIDLKKENQKLHEEVKAIKNTEK